MVQTRRRWVAFRRPSLPQEGHGAWLGAHRTGMVRTWGLRVSMACVLRWAWYRTHQHAGRISLRQGPFQRVESRSGSARSVTVLSPFPAPRSLSVGSESDHADRRLTVSGEHLVAAGVGQGDRPAVNADRPTPASGVREPGGFVTARGVEGVERDRALVLPVEIHRHGLGQGRVIDD